MSTDEPSIPASERQHVPQYTPDSHPQETVGSDASDREECLDGAQVSAPQFILGIACTLWVLMLLFSLVLLVLFGALPSLSLGSEQPSACHPDGTFSPFGQDYSPWALQGLFQINLGLGNLTFTQAKVIDVVWDIGIGRGGQAVMALVSWRVFSDYIATSQVAVPITYLSFRVLFIESTPSIASTWKLAQDFHLRRGLRSKVATIFIVWSMLLMLGWPTFAGAATGYTPTTAAFILVSDDNLVPFYMFQPIAYIIHDGSRVNLTDQYPIPLLAHPVFEDPVLRSSSSLTLQHDSMCDKYPAYFPCMLQVAVSNYGVDYGFNDIEKSTWYINSSTYDLTGGLLDIEPLSIAPEDWKEWKAGSDPTKKPDAESFRDGSRTAWWFSDKRYNLNDIQDNGKCQPLQDRFRWGFSFLQIFILVLSLLVWTVGIYLLWLKSRFRLPCQNPLGVPRGYTALILLANTIQEHFGELGLSARHLSEKELKSEIQEPLGGGTILPGVSRNFDTFRSWLAQDKNWFIAISFGITVSLILISTQVILLSRMFGIQPPVSISAIALKFGQFVDKPLGASLLFISSLLLSSSFGLLAAVVVTKGPKVRWLLAFCWGVCGLIVALTFALSLRPERYSRVSSR